MANLLGIEIGTRRCKASLFDESGFTLITASREYPVEAHLPGWVEQDIEIVWGLLQDALQEAIYNAGVREVSALALSVHSGSITPVDQDGLPLRPTILGHDTRASAQNEWLRQHLGAEELYRHTGLPVHTVNIPPKLLWIKEHEPDIWEKAARFLQVEDFVIQKMTGKAVISACLASRTGLFDLDQGAWSTQILETLELDPSRLAEVQFSGEAVAVMKPELADSIGLLRAPLVVAGGHIHGCSALGAGVTAPGLGVVSTRTDEVVQVVLSAPVLSPSFYKGNISVYHHVVPGLFLAMTSNQAGGSVLRWFRDDFCEMQIEQAARTGEDAYDLILQGAPDSPTGLLLAPHFSGSGTPTFDTAARGAILGLTFETTRAQIAKAILEGLTCELRQNLDMLREECGVGVSVLRATGGGANSPLWLQLKADITGLPVEQPRQTGASGVGAAILAGAGAGIYPQAIQAADQIVQIEAVYEPQPDRMAAYQNHFELYRQLYPALKDIYHQL